MNLWRGTSLVILGLLFSIVGTRAGEGRAPELTRNDVVDAGVIMVGTVVHKEETMYLGFPDGKTMTLKIWLHQVLKGSPSTVELSIMDNRPEVARQAKLATVVVKGIEGRPMISTNGLAGTVGPCGLSFDTIAIGDKRIWFLTHGNPPYPYRLRDSRPEKETEAVRTAIEKFTKANPQGGANGRQPLGSETNQTSPAAASRRSP